MSLHESSNLILVPMLNILFTKNRAQDAGGALHIEDFQCLLGSLVPIEFFLSIQSSFPTIRNISLHFENNSAGSMGSTLYGGQLSKCRLHTIQNQLFYR